MPDPKNWAVSDFGSRNSCFLVIGTTEFDLISFTSAFAVNEIPQAQCVVPVGRNVSGNSAGERAPIHDWASILQDMQEARVYLRVFGEYSPTGGKWPEQYIEIFRGYTTGFSYRRAQGKVQAVISLGHWLSALTFSSALAANSHPSNPFALTANAVYQQTGDAGQSQGAFLSKIVNFSVPYRSVTTDLWAGIKEMLAKLADTKTSALGPSESRCGSGASFNRNSAALAALGDIEGPSSVSGRPYEFGVPLKIESFGVPTVGITIANQIANTMVSSFAGTTLWHKIINDYCPAYGLAVLPQADRALVVADTPAFSGEPWKTIEPDTYESFDQTSFIEKPLKAVAVYGNFGSATGQANGQDAKVLGGCFVASSVNESDGQVQYVVAPGWLDQLASAYNTANNGVGIMNQRPIRSATNPTDNALAFLASGATTTVGIKNDIPQAWKLYQAYARMVYAANALRGRSGSISGKLRFDIGPGSNVRIKGSVERFTGSADSLTETQYGCVVRVTTVINCESPYASTTFQLTHLRTETENRSDRYSVNAHPLFGSSIHGQGKHGCPLVADLAQ